MTDYCPGCAWPISPMEKLLGKCAKDGGPLDRPRETIQLTGAVLVAAREEETKMTKLKINKTDLLHLQARASVLELALRDPERRERLADDAHDLVNVVLFLLQDNGLELIEEPDAADLAFAKSHLGATAEQWDLPPSEWVR